MNLYCDYDGVLVNHRKGFNDVLGHSWYDDEYFISNGIDKKKLISEYPDFWANLERMPDYGLIWDYIKGHSPSIITAYADWDKGNSIAGKRQWNDKHTQLPQCRLHIVARCDKQNFAFTDQPNLLIDDSELNISEWIAGGGIGVWHNRNRATATIDQLKAIGVY